jgi:HlyD family secretion protein
MVKLSLKQLPRRPSWKSLKVFAIEHKALSALIVLALFSGVYGTLKAKNTSTVPHYILGKVTRGTITSSVSGTGTVSASDQIDLKAKASGEVTAIPAKTGSNLTQGTLIVAIDASDASIALQSAQLSLAKITEAPDQSSLIQNQQALTDAKTAQIKAYADAFNETASTFLDVPSIIDGMDALLYTNAGYLNDSSVASHGTTAISYRMTAGARYDSAKREYQNLATQYKQITLSSSQAALNDIYGRTQLMLADLVQALKDTNLAVEYKKNIEVNSSDPASVHSAQVAASSVESSLSGWTTQASTHLNALTADITAIQNSPNTIAAKQAALDKFVQGADALDVASARLNVEQKLKAYNDSFVRAPFSGVLGRVSVRVGDTVSGGTTVATMISSDRVADVSLNEVDAAKVKSGDKATLTFDAVDGLTITGTVSEIDLVGTVTQGVVNYNAKIIFDTDDSRILPGMSTSAEIITDTKTNVLTVPSSAVKRDAQGSYVLAFRPPLTPSSKPFEGVISATAPMPISVQLGLTSDTMVEIVSGLDEGDQIVTRVTNSSATTATGPSSGPNFFGGQTRGATGGGARALGR